MRNRLNKPQSISGDNEEIKNGNDGIQADNSTAKTDFSAIKQPNKSWLTLIFSRMCTILKWVLLVSVIPPFLNFAALQRESALLLPENGQLYDIGKGQKLYMSCQGKGLPTVILDAPTGQSSDIWLPIQEEVSKLTKVCVYDRAGLGFSDRPAQVKLNVSSTSVGAEFTVERMVDDLRTLIAVSSQQPKPYILVGAEISTLVARFYAHMFESDVTDIVLLDPLVENLFTVDDGLWAKHWFSQVASHQSLQLGAAFGINRIGLLIGALEPPSFSQGSEHVLRRQKFLQCHPRHLSSAVDEHFFVNESMSQMKTLRMMKPFPSNISITVINGNYYDEQLPGPLNKAWAKSQQHLLNALHPSAKHIVINGADHNMIFKVPKILSETITRTVKRTRQKLRQK